MEKGRITSYYDELLGRCIADFVYGNPRVEAAITHCLRWITPDAKRILDLGCGIGWSTHEIKRHYPQAFVLGVDISPKMIDLARRLFGEAGVEFRAHDICNWVAAFSPPYEVIVLIDVYEHIPKDRRSLLHQVLRRALDSNGVIILTFPSVFHQEFLRKFRPEGLQPVDEDVTRQDMEILARDVGGSVAYWSYVNIWSPKDYVHVVIARNREVPSSAKRKRILLEPRAARKKRVKERLQVRVTREGVVLKDKGDFTVCIVSPNKNAYSETFIRAHIERLPAKVKVLYGGWFPAFTEDDRPLLSRSLFHRGVRFLMRRIFGVDTEWFQNRALRRYLRKERIQAVLAEYGPTGVSVMEACRAEGVPLIVHFHGFDAFDYKTLEKYGSAYKRMFSTAAAVIAVSRDMEQQLLTLGAPRERLFYNPCGVDTSLFSGADPASAPPLFVAVGRFVDKKAPHLTLLAFKKVADVRPDARLVMTSDGKLWEACKQLARALRIEEAVEFLGVRPPSEVAFTLRKARAFVQHSLRTSYGDSEGTPVAVLEAGATGLPVVSTRHGGIKDVVIDGKTGFLVDEGDIDGMAERMLLLAKDPELAAQMGKRARERICAEFSMEKSIGRLWQIIEETIQKYRKR